LLLSGEAQSWSEAIKVAIRGKDGLGANGELIEGDPSIFNSSPLLMDVLIPGGRWQMAAIPANGWNTQSIYQSLYFQFGCAITLLLSLLARLKTTHHLLIKQRNAALEVEITHRSQIENDLREEKNRFRTLFESSPDPAWILEGNKFVECNPAATEILGCNSRDDALNVHPSELSPEFQPDGQSSFTKAEQMIETARNSGVFRFEWVHLRHDGSPFLAEVTLICITMNEKQWFYAIWRDITERKKNEERLSLAATILQSTAEGVMITDPAARILSVNRAFTEITGFSEEEVLGKCPNILKSSRHQEDFYQALWKSIELEGVWQGEIWNRRKSGDIFPEWLVISTIYNDKHEVTHYVAVFSDISLLKNSQSRLEHLAHFDPLTDLPNRILFQDRLSYALDQADRYSRNVALLLLDLDGFKTVNDSLGHPVGDELLVMVAKRLQACIRVEDTVARLGGDEFGVILSGMADSADSIEVVRKILVAIEQPFDLSGHTATISTSIGIAVYPADGANPTDLVRNADAAMYEAKEGGRNTYRFYQTSMTETAQDRLHLEADLKKAIEQKQFEVWFQPQKDLKTGHVTGAEALVRWRHPERGLVPPGEFIPLAERSGLIIPIGEQVLTEVCRRIRSWLNAGIAIGRIAINVALPQLERGDFLNTIKQTLLREDVPAHYIEVEITESFLMSNKSITTEVLTQLQTMGITIAIDDFGTGYSSLAYLHQLPIDNLKIDQAFVREIDSCDNNRTITRAIIAMGHSLGYKIIAEGIEEPSQQEWLRNEGCDEAQGYLLAKPMPAAEFEDWLQNR
jgi:diguanylate cyclase (GGDEF)-like protein/PAS domain S-box-containing protein